VGALLVVMATVCALAATTKAENDAATEAAVVSEHDRLVNAWNATMAAKEAADDELIAALLAYVKDEQTDDAQRAQMQVVLNLAYHSRGETETGDAHGKAAIKHWLETKDTTTLTAEITSWGRILTHHFGEQLAELTLYDEVAAAVATAELPPIAKLELARVKAHRGMGDHEGALAICVAALASEPPASTAIMPKERRLYWTLSEHRASLLHNLGKHDDSLKVWSDRYEASSTPEAKAECLWQLASLCDISRRQVAAIGYYKQLIDEFPTSPLAARSSAQLAKLKRDMLRDTMSDMPGLE